MKKIIITLLVFVLCLSSLILAKEKELNIYSPNALLYDVTYDKILYEKNINEKIPNASTTKILTAIVAYENSNMDDVVEVSVKAASIGGSKINLRKGDKVKMDSLMKGLLMSSGNDAAIAIAEHVGGSIEEFCDLMNKRAIELGAQNTNFTTPHGLDNDEHYTTLSDLLIFSKYFMQIPYLREIANTEKTMIKINNYEKELRSTNEMLFLYDGVNGVKTGYTSKAGRCLITSIESGDRNLITMVLGCETKKQRTEETIKLISYGYDNFEVVDILEKMQSIFEMRIRKAVKEKYELEINGNKKVLLAKNEKDDIRYEYEIVEMLTAPVEKGSEIGKIKIFVKDNLIYEMAIKLPKTIERKDFFYYFLEIFQNQNLYLEIKT